MLSVWKSESQSERDGRQTDWEKFINKQWDRERDRGIQRHILRCQTERDTSREMTDSIKDIWEIRFNDILISEKKIQPWENRYTHVKH